MKKHVYKIDENGHIKGIHVAGFDELGNAKEELATNIIKIDPPQGLYRAKWTETEWVEDMTQAEIDALNAPTVDSLKSQLAETDYKIIQCSEYQLAGQPLPYDIQALHTERQTLRDQINQLELNLI